MLGAHKAITVDGRGEGCFASRKYLDLNGWAESHLLGYNSHHMVVFFVFFFFLIIMLKYCPVTIQAE